MFEFESGIVLFSFILSLFRLKNCVCLSRGVQVAGAAGGRCGMACSNEDRGRSRRLGAEDQEWSSTGRVLGGRMIERPGDVVCGLHHAQ